MMESVVNRVYALQYRLQRYWWKRRSKRSRIQGKCLVFHHINEISTDTLESCQCNPGTFERILVDFVAQGYRFVSVDEALSRMDARSGEKFAVVTFDDVPGGYVYERLSDLEKVEYPVHGICDGGLCRQSRFPVAWPVGCSERGTPVYDRSAYADPSPFEGLSAGGCGNLRFEKPTRRNDRETGRIFRISLWSEKHGSRGKISAARKQAVINARSVRSGQTCPTIRRANGGFFRVWL